MFKIGFRNRKVNLPEYIEDLVSKNDPVRVYDAFVENLNLENLGFNLNEKKLGPSSYYPKAMVKLLLYSYSYGISSSRKIERACHHNLSYIWLMGGLKPDHKTISKFRQNNLTAFKRIMIECAKLCIKLDLIDGNVLFVDGSKFRSNANISRFKSLEYCKEYIIKLENRIDEILSKISSIDQDEEKLVSLSSLKTELGCNQSIMKRVKNAMNVTDEGKSEKKKSLI